MPSKREAKRRLDGAFSFLEQGMDEGAETKWRGTGRTTDLALWYVNIALRNKGKIIEVHDHHPTREAARILQHKVSDVLGVLNIEHRVYNLGWPSVQVIPQEGFNGIESR